jgi:hypothetical protein
MPADKPTQAPGALRLAGVFGWLYFLLLKKKLVKHVKYSLNSYLS